jgi:probable O-glycosylation ligase (exosortase A-associated)
MTYYLLLLFFVFDYIRPGTYIPGLDAAHFNSLIPILTIVCTLAIKTRVSNKDALAETNTALMGTLLVMLCVSTLFAIVTEYAFTTTKNVFAYILIYFVIVRQVGDLRRLKGVFMTLVLVHIVVTALNPAMFLEPDNRVPIDSGAFLGDGNDFSLSINVCLPLCLFLLLESNKKLHKAGWVFVLLIMVMAIVATKSRGGTLALLAIGIYFWLKSNRKVLTAALALLTVLVVLVAAPPSYFKRMATMTDTEESSAQGRIDAWKTSTKIALKSPLLGAGAGNFPSAFGAMNQSRWMTAHSIYFLILGEMGFPGLLLLLTIIISNLTANARLLRKVKRERPDLLTAINMLSCTSASMLGFAVGGAFLSAVYYPHLYLISGMMTATRRLAREQMADAGAERPAAATVMQPLARHGAISPDWRPRAAYGLHSGGSSLHLTDNRK